MGQRIQKGNKLTDTIPGMSVQILSCAVLFFCFIVVVVVFSFTKPCSSDANILGFIAYVLQNSGKEMWRRDPPQICIQCLLTSSVGREGK